MSNHSSTRIIRINDLPNGEIVSHPAWIGLLVDYDVEVAIHKTAVWIRFDSTNEAVVRVETRVPGQRFELLTDEGDPFRLVPVGKKTATNRLPADLQWLPIDKVIDWKLPTAALSANTTTCMTAHCFKPR